MLWKKLFSRDTKGSLTWWDNQYCNTFLMYGFDCKIERLSIGLAGRLSNQDRCMHIFLTSTVRDGIFVNIKTTAPWNVMFEYSNGVYFVNDSPREKYAVLINSLQILQCEFDEKRYDYERVFARLLDSICEYIRKTI